MEALPQMIWSYNGIPYIPKRKRKLLSLQNFCLEIVVLHLDRLKHLVKDLPVYLIEELHCKSVHNCHFLALYKRATPLLPANLFFHGETKMLHTLCHFDLPEDKLAEKIRRDCRKLRSIRLHQNINYLDILTINNPNILRIDLCNSRDCTNQHLFLIGRHCPQLQHLNVKCCKLITDDGINHLPIKIITLYLPVEITTNGYMLALKRLPLLKTLSYPVSYPYPSQTAWMETINLLLAEKSSGQFGNEKYQLEEVWIDLNRQTSKSVVDDVVLLFPKLRNIALRSTQLVEDVDLFQAINCNLITRIRLQVSMNFVRVCTQVCAMLKEVDCIIYPAKGLYDTRHMAKSASAPLKHLLYLKISVLQSSLMEEDFKYLLSNCEQLVSLSVADFCRLSNQLISDVLAINPLKHVTKMSFNRCRPFCIKSLPILLQSLNSLNDLRIFCCLNLPKEQKKPLKKLIREINPQVNLDFIWLGGWAYPGLKKYLATTVNQCN